MIKVIVYYHSKDFDGICSGAIARVFLSNANSDELSFIGYDYSDTFDWSVIDKETSVLMLDVSLPPLDMKRMKESAKSFIWIDHHQRQIDEVNALIPGGVSGIQRSGIAACQLTWEWFSSDECPLVVKLLGEYDVFNFKDSRTLPFQHGVRMNVKGIHDMFWDIVLKPGDRDIQYLVDEGKMGMKYVEHLRTTLGEELSFASRLIGYDVIVINRAKIGSHDFEGFYVPEKHDFMVSFYMNKHGNYVYSLRSARASIDVSEIAGWLGGGGHPAAAGFSSPVFLLGGLSVFDEDFETPKEIKMGFNDLPIAEQSACEFLGDKRAFKPNVDYSEFIGCEFDDNLNQYKSTDTRISRGELAHLIHMGWVCKNNDGLFVEMKHVAIPKQITNGGY